MSKYGTIVMGPAGAGKTTFCSALIEHLQNSRRSCFYVNLDPAAEDFTYQPDLDIKDLISLEDVMEEMGLGPNGGLIYCFEFLLENLDFLTEALDPLTEEYLIVIDMPGQIELYTHIPVIPQLVAHLTASGALGVRLCATYLLESTFVVDRAKFFAGTLSAMSAMLLLEMPHVNVLSKMDLVKGQMPRREFKRFVHPDASLLDEDDPGLSGALGPVAVARDLVVPGNVRPDLATTVTSDDFSSEDPARTESVMGGASFKKLNKAVAGLIDSFSMVSFLQLDVQDEDSVGAILSYIDDAIQFHEAQEPKEPKESDFYEGDGEDGLE